MDRRKTFALIASVAALIVLVALFLMPACAKEAPAPAPEAAPTIDWKWQCAYPPGDHEADMAVPSMIDFIEDQTDGRFTLTRYYEAEIIPPKEILTGIGQGLAEVGNGALDYGSGVEPALDLGFGLPMAFFEFGDTTAFHMDSRWGEMLRGIFAENGCHFVGWQTYGTYPILCSRVPIYTIDDWKGVKVRISGYNGALLEAMGASTTYIPGGEIAEALTMGTIDVGSWGPECIKDMGFGEIMDYLIMPPYMRMGGGIWVNQEAWDSLPDGYQEIIDAGSRRYNRESYEFGYAYMKDNVELATGAGTPGPYGYDVIYFSDEDIAEMTRLAKEAVWEDWAKLSPRCAEAIEILKDWKAGTVSEAVAPDFREPY